MAIKTFIFSAALFALIQCSDSSNPDAHNARDFSSYGIWDTDGLVKSSVVHGDKLYIGGGFRCLGPAIGSAVFLNPDTGEWISQNLRVEGKVYAAVALPDGSIILGGNFSRVNGEAHQGLAKISPSGEIEPNWGRDVFFSIEAMAVSGSTLYVAGSLSRIGSEGQFSGLAALDINTGAPTSWKPTVSPSKRLTSLLVDGGKLYVGGMFSNINGSSRNNLAAFDTQTGLLTDFNPKVSGEQYDGVKTMLMVGSTLFIGGDFTTVNGTVTRKALAGINSATGIVTDFDAQLGGSLAKIFSLSLSNGLLYISGHFNSIRGISRQDLASLDPNTGIPSSWAPNFSPYGSGYSLTIAGGKVYVGGSIYFKDLERVNFAVFDQSTGDLLPIDVGFLNTVEVTFMVNGRLFVAGTFSGFAKAKRPGIAQIDLNTGAPTEWNPSSHSILGNPAVYALEKSGDTLFAGGGFNQMNGEPRMAIAAFDMTSGNLLPWKQSAFISAQVNALKVTGNTVVVAGVFFDSGNPRKTLAAFDANSGAILNWNPELNSTNAPYPEVEALAVRNNTVFVGGKFETADSPPRKHLAAFTLDDNLPTNWNPQPNGIVSSLASNDDYLFVGGSFMSIDGYPQNGVSQKGFAAFNSAGILDSYFSENFSGSMFSLKLIGNTLYLGGFFYLTAENFISYGRAIDISLKSYTPFDVRDAHLYTFEEVGPNVFIGGSFNTFQQTRRQSTLIVDANGNHLP